MYHIGICSNDIKGTNVAILVGDPGRVEFLSRLLDPLSKPIKRNREYVSYLAELKSTKVLICSTGIGGPSTAIAVEELAMIGIKEFIRVGTTGAIQEKINLGDLIISNAAVRLDGTSCHYAPVEYPAQANFELTQKLVNSANNLDIPTYLGISASSDTFYPGQERYDNYSGYILKKFQNSLEEWRKLNVLNLEMESSTLFVVCSVFGLKAACICVTIAKRTDSEQIDKSKYNIGIKNIVKIIKEIL